MNALVTVPQMSQDEIILRHLKEIGNISGVEASTVYKCRSLTSVISRLMKRGWIIDKETKRDATGQRYVRYSYEASKQTRS